MMSMRTGRLGETLETQCDGLVHEGLCPDPVAGIVWVVDCIVQKWSIEPDSAFKDSSRNHRREFFIVIVTKRGWQLLKTAAKSAPAAIMVLREFVY
jgi:hypothetical protein